MTQTPTTNKPHLWHKAVNQASAALTSTLDLDELLLRILEQLETVFPHDAANVMLIDEDGVTRVSRGRGYERFGTQSKLPEIAMNVSAVAGLRQMQESKRPLIIADVQSDPQWVYSIPEHRWIGSYIGMPLVLQGRVIGFLNILSKQAGFFAQANAKPLEIFAHHAAIAVQNAQLYQKLQRQNENLEAQVAARTRELTVANHRLREANEALKLSNKELNAYAHTVAHDLQNPLTNILGFVEMIRHKRPNSPDTAAIESELTAIAKTSWQMSRIVANLLLLANVRQQKIRIEPLDMPLIVENALLTLTHLVNEKKATFRQRRTWPVACGFAPWVEIIWANYISNALKYGGSPPHVELGADPPQDGFVRFWVRDNGPGVSPEHQIRLFAEFARLDDKRASGHGLGLSIVRQICDKLGGEAGVTSAPGEGSLFWFTLPRQN